jgi:diaminohydroxyphosphoribosylaminopyrimidine deaminase/5-amino-6-(5-phosphoribosylamino)uracil reductase
VIAQRGRIVGEGWHARAGGNHAEVEALRAAGEGASGAHVYVTLEPCSHHGRTPPCVEALSGARVARVVYAIGDPNPLVNGRGAAALRASGIEVETGLMEKEAAELNAGFIGRMQTGRPLVRMKLAMSLDGRTALANGASRWITGESAREDVQHWRARSSAVLTGIGTVLADDPRLDVRLPPPVPGGERRQPLRVVLDAQLRTPATARLLDADGEALIFTALSAPEDPRAMRLSQRGARVESLPASGERLELPAVLERLGELEVNELLVEAGATLAGALLHEGLVDELLLYVAPKFLGPTARPLVALPALQRIDDACAYVLLGVQQFGDDLRLRLRPRAPVSG